MASKKHVFTAVEKKCFMDILKKYSNIIESKETDGSSLRIKNEAWDRIAAEFNTSPHAVSQASSKQLRRLWMNLKQRQRESLTKERQHRLATGGGPSTSDADIDPDVSAIAPALIVGIDTAIDSDTIEAKEEVYMIIDDQSTMTTPELPLSVEVTTAVTESHSSSSFNFPIIAPTSTTPPATPSLPTPPLHSSRSQPVTTQRQKNNILEMEYRDRKRRAEEKHEIEMLILREQLIEAKAKAQHAVKKLHE